VTGRVVEFDDHRGLGVVEGNDGRRYPFHCTAIVDDTRTIPSGVNVEFEMITGPLGRTEAGSIRYATCA
jgi:cold shock CspA family protein